MELKLSGLPCETKEKADRISGWISDQPQINSLPCNLEHLPKSQRQYAGDKLLSLSHLVLNSLKDYLCSFTTEVQLPPLPDSICFTILSLSISSG